MCTGACRCCPPWLHSLLRMLPNQARMALSSYFSYMSSKIVTSVKDSYSVSTKLIYNAKPVAQVTLFFMVMTCNSSLWLQSLTVRYPCILFCTQRQTAKCCMHYNITLVADRQGLTISNCKLHEFATRQTQHRKEASAPVDTPFWTLQGQPRLAMLALWSL